jgi:hypothetical protein
MRTSLLFCLLLGLASGLCFSCAGASSSPDSGHSDAGTDGGADLGADPGADPGADLGGAGDPGDVDLGGGFGLIIPEGTQACTVFSSYLIDTRLEIALKGRVTFKAGVVPLPTDQDSFEADFIAQLEFGRDRAIGTPKGPGVFTRAAAGAQNDYDFNQTFAVAGEDYRLSFKVTFFTGSGSKTLTLDEALLSNEFDFRLQGIIGDGSDPGHQVRNYMTCRYTTWLPTPFALTATNGDTISFERRMGGDICKICPTAIVDAHYTHGADTRAVTDPFRLAYAAGHHNWFEQYLILFDAPVGDVHGLYLPGGAEGEAPATVDYLDADLNVLRSSPVTPSF